MDPQLATEQTEIQALLASYGTDLAIADETDWRDVLQSLQDDLLLLKKPSYRILTKEEKEKLGKELTLHLLKAFDAGAATTDDLPDVSSYLLMYLEKIETDVEMADFLYLLRERWEFFSDYAPLANTDHLSGREQIEALAKRT